MENPSVALNQPQDNKKLTQTLIKHLYVQGKSEYSLFTNKEMNKIAILFYLCGWYHDKLITSNYQNLIKELKRVPTKNYKIKDLGELKYFRGIKIARSKDGITLNQRKYALVDTSRYSYGTKPKTHFPRIS